MSGSSCRAKLVRLHCRASSLPSSTIVAAHGSTEGGVVCTFETWARRKTLLATSAGWSVDAIVEGAEEEETLREINELQHRGR